MTDSASCAIGLSIGLLYVSHWVGERFHFLMTSGQFVGEEPKPILDHETLNGLYVEDTSCAVSEEDSRAHKVEVEGTRNQGMESTTNNAEESTRESVSV